MSRDAGVFYRFDIVTDPNDPQTNDSIKSSSIDIESHYDRGLVRCKLSGDRQNIFIQPVAYKISYVPVTITLDLSQYKDKKDVITGLCGIIKALANQELSIDVKNVETVQLDNNIFVFSIITSENIAVYTNPNYMNDFYKLIRPSFIIGYQLLSTDPLVNYIIDQEHIDIEVRYIKNIAIIPVGNDDIVDKVDNLIKFKREEGYFTYDIGIHNIKDMELVRKLAQDWQCDYVYDKDMTTIVLHNKGVDFGTLPKLWFQDNVLRIKNGNVPKITLYGYWQLYPSGIAGTAIDDNDFYPVIIRYAAMLAYRDSYVTSGDSIKADDVVVNGDLSITVSLPTYNHLLNYSNNLRNSLKGYFGVRDEKKYSMMTEATDLTTGTNKRYYVQTIDDKAFPMILPYNNINVLVFRSPMIEQYNDYFDFQSIDLSNYKIHITTNDEWALRGLYDITGQTNSGNLVTLKGLY